MSQSWLSLCSMLRDFFFIQLALQYHCFHTHTVAHFGLDTLSYIYMYCIATSLETLSLITVQLCTPIHMVPLRACAPPP